MDFLSSLQVTSLQVTIVDHLFSRLPQSPAGWFLQIVGGLVASYVVLTFFEWYIHKNMMHKQGLRPKFLYKLLPILPRLVHRHAVLHHNTFYKQFDFEPDPNGKDENINIRFYQTLSMAVTTAPVILFLLYFSAVGTFIFMLGGYAHNKAWNILHTQMHMPRDVWWRKSWFFRTVSYLHFLHHQFQNTHFNVVLPGADFIIGSVAKPRVGDLREMMRLGYVLPRSARAKKIVAAGMKPREGYTFEDAHESPAAPLLAAA